MKAKRRSKNPIFFHKTLSHKALFTAIPCWQAMGRWYNGAN
jgi:hypothetical protein